MAQKNRNTFNNQKKAKVQNKPSFVSASPQKEKKAKKPSMISSKESIAYAALALLVFVGVAIYELIINNSDMLFMAQERNMFTSGCQFFSELTKVPGCIGAWLGCYLTQYFYNPAVGSAMLIGIWCIIYLLTKKAFRINNTWAFVAIIPVACLLVSIIDNGYWLYYMKQPGYWFRESLGFLFTIVSYYITSRLNKNLKGESNITTSVIQSAAIALITFGGYYAFGWYALLAPLYTIFNQWICEKTSITSKIIVTATSLISIIVIPLICYNNFFTELRSEDVWLGGFPFFKADAAVGMRNEIPFAIMALVPTLFPLVARLQNKENITGLMANLFRLGYVAVVVAAMPYFIDKMNFDNYNYHAEFRMYRATAENRWDDVIEESANYQGVPTREMVILNHIALLNKETMGTQMFKFNNFGEAPYVADTTFVKRTEKDADGKMAPVLNEKGEQVMDSLFLRVHMVQTAGPLIYYNHAKTNFASRWCIENSVEYGYSFDTVKMLIRCALVNGEWDVARKYIDILKQSTFQKDWALKYEPILADHSKIKEFHEFDKILELYNHMGSALDGDQGLCEMYLLNYFANTMNKDSKLLQELTLNYALIQKDIQLFWPRFFLYAQLHKDEKMPIHYQEAAFLYGNLEHQVNISHMPFDKEIPERYASFQQISESYLKQGMNTEQVGKAMQPDFGNTFWWFYFFCRDVKSY